MSDLISRELAVELLENTIAMTKKEERRRNYCVELIKAMPSAEPERRTGIWMGSVCSECGNSTSFYYDCDYCPNCGARMEDEK